MITSAFLLLFIVNVSAQRSEGGLPVSFDLLIENDYPAIFMPSINIDSIKLADEQDAEISGKGIRPSKFGHEFETEIDMLVMGNWTNVEGGRICRLKITSLEALSLNFIFSNFRLSEGGKLFIYSEDRKNVLGAFTAKTSNNHVNVFATDLIEGSSVVFEYFEPTTSTQAKIVISQVIHGYTSMMSSPFGDASCHVSAGCPPGDPFCVEKRSVVKIIVGSQSGSGVLINNTAEDLTPYILTAFHNADANRDGVISTSEKANINTWVFRFNYIDPSCPPIGAATYTSFAGADFRASYFPTDMLLIEMFTTPTPGDGVFYSGWSRVAGGMSPSKGTGLHHPEGAPMRISIDNDPLTFSSGGGPQPSCGFPNNFWLAHFDVGLVQHGSSGSPIYNEDRLVIGQLWGYCYNSCSKGNDECWCVTQPRIGQYGRFDISWFGGGNPLNPDDRLSDWLDPIGTNPSTLSPASSTINMLNQTISGTNNFAALRNLHLEGQRSGIVCYTPNIDFTIQSGSNIVFRAQSFTIGKSVSISSSADVNFYISNVNCSHNIIDGNCDY